MNKVFCFVRNLGGRQVSPFCSHAPHARARYDLWHGHTNNQHAPREKVDTTELTQQLYAFFLRTYMSGNACRSWQVSLSSSSNVTGQRYHRLFEVWCEKSRVSQLARFALLQRDLVAKFVCIMACRCVYLVTFKKLLNPIFKYPQQIVLPWPTQSNGITPHSPLQIAVSSSSISLAQWDGLLGYMEQCFCFYASFYRNCLVVDQVKFTQMRTKEHWLHQISLIP